MTQATLELLGTGMSHGVPVLGCTCEVCKSQDSNDQRLRTSALLRSSNTAILFDCGPDFRVQALRAKLNSLTAALISHVHADHVFGLDDLRVFTESTNLPIYGSKTAIDDIVEHFNYIFRKTQEGGGKPHFAMRTIHANSPIKLNEITLIPVALQHDYPDTYGFRFGNTAYLTDLFNLPEESYELVKGVDNVLIDAVRPGVSRNHLNFEKALEIIAKIHPKQAYFIHIDHSMKHTDIQAYIDDYISKRPEMKDIKVQPGYDGLQINVLI